MRLRASSPPVTRLSRRVLVGVSSLALGGVAVALAIALWPHKNVAPKEEPQVAGSVLPDAVTRLPERTIRSLPQAPKLGPPLPGDLGKPMLKAGDDVTGYRQITLAGTATSCTRTGCGTHQSPLCDKQYAVGDNPSLIHKHDRARTPTISQALLPIRPVSRTCRRARLRSPTPAAVRKRSARRASSIQHRLI